MFDAWAVREADYPEDGSLEDQLRFCLRYAILAPSTHNSQPWLFRVAAGRVEVFADRTRALPVADPDDRELTISCGAALFMLRAALRRFGFRPETLPFPAADDPDLLAVVHAGRAAEPNPLDVEICRAIPFRRTSRRPFAAAALEPRASAAISAAAAVEGAWLKFVDDEEHRLALAALITEGDRRQGGDRSFRREMAAWAHPGRARSGDGLPGYAYGSGDLSMFIGPTVVRSFETTGGTAADGAEIAEDAPALAVLGVADDAPAGWLAAGQALAHALLVAKHHGLDASYLNQPTEVADLRLRLRSSLGLSAPPQLVLRVGRGPEVPPTQRRPLEDVLLP